MLRLVSKVTVGSRAVLYRSELNEADQFNCWSAATSNRNELAARLFDDVGLSKQGRRNIEAESRGGFQVDHQLEYRRLHDRQFGRLSAVENSTDVDAALAKGLGKAGAVAH